MKEELNLLCIVLERKININQSKPGLVGGRREDKPAFHFQYQGFHHLCGKKFYSFIQHILIGQLYINFLGIYQEKISILTFENHLILIFKITSWFLPINIWY